MHNHHNIIMHMLIIWSIDSITLNCCYISIITNLPNWTTKTKSEKLVKHPKVQTFKKLLVKVQNTNSNLRSSHNTHNSTHTSAQRDRQTDTHTHTHTHTHTQTHNRNKLII